MELGIIKVDAANLMNILTDPNVYVIHKYAFLDRVEMSPIKKVDVEDVLSDKNLVVRIITK
jgi:hypothetical protein